MIVGFFFTIILVILLIVFIASLFSSAFVFIFNIVLLIALGSIIYNEMKKDSMHKYYLWSLLVTGVLFIGRDFIKPFFNIFSSIGLMQISTAVVLIYLLAQLARYVYDLMKNAHQ